jgi:hypothetical protein
MRVLFARLAQNVNRPVSLVFWDWFLSHYDYENKLELYMEILFFYWYYSPESMLLQKHL